MTQPGFFEGTGMPDADWWAALWPDPAAVLHAVGMIPGIAAADLCAGDGWFTLTMARIARLVFAIDIDEGLLDAARGRARRAGLDNCRFIAGDAYAIARLLPQPVDFVLLANAFHGAPEKPRLARAIRDALKPQGLLAIIGWQAQPREETIVLGAPRGPATALRMTPDATIAAVTPGGFEAVKQVELPPYHYGIAFRRAEQ